MQRPSKENQPEYYQYYISLVEENNGLLAMDGQIIKMQQLIGEIPVEKEDYRYAPGKWTIKEVIGHITDTERIFGYRALCIARGEQNPLPGYDDQNYVLNGNFNSRSLYDLVHEFSVVRESNLVMFKSFDEAAKSRVGIANNTKVSIQALLFMILGHEIHHLKVIREKYLNS
jgi:hypothetical protein